jgi:hypothetical protein
MKTIGLVFFVLFSMVSVGYSACEGDFDCDGDVDGSDLAVFAADFGRTDCGPCEDVIDLIEALESRIESLENKTPKGYNARRSTPNIEPSETMIPVCTLTIPPGDYVMTMIIHASYFYQGSFDPAYTTYVECVCTDPNGNEIMGCGIAGSVSNHSTLSQTIGQWTNNDIPYITMQCKHNPMVGSDTIGISISWSAIKVDEINFQPQ